MSGTVLSLGHLIYLIAWRRLIALVNRLIFRSVFGLHLGRIGVHLLRLSLWQCGDHLLGLLSQDHKCICSKLIVVGRGRGFHKNSIGSLDFLY